ncbi:hypothetical protein [Thermoproteus tenax]|uniref:Uncharacterized protein n=1 Tax=Thermoproteus tenax (strain ATCC 35583 / DSM 2078 / JCM 9277 / NBRC 100435 / Kra 1) TaxID=768679 RepID=G4RKV1_THETK|nr:hypothetical protein [Thermoproteus tenax]CCC82196.1 hypothetical protein TTX_1569 [Thermoproteus tenax Kra 1]
MELPEITEGELENPSFNVSGPAEYTVSFGSPCKIAVNVRLDVLMMSWPRVFAKALMAVYKCGEFWPHFDVRGRAISFGKTIYTLIDSVARHNESDAEIVPLERGPLWNYLAELGAIALCKTVRSTLNIQGRCRIYTSVKSAGT